MPTTSIPISVLNPLNQVSSSDYIAVVQTSTTTTFKSQLQVVGNWISSSVQASSSLQSVSASYSISSSNGLSSSIAQIANNLIYPNTSTSSYSITSSNAITSSFALSSPNALFAVSASWSSQSFSSTSASFASASVTSSFSLFTPIALVSTSASWASASITSSHAITSSYSISSSFSTFALTSSVCLTPTTQVYPYIQSITFSGSHDDDFNVNFNALGFTNTQFNSNCISFPLNSPTTYYHRVDYNPSIGFYVGSYGPSISSLSIVGYSSGPKTECMMWGDNRSGGSYHVTFNSNVIICFATSPTTGITHSYVTTSGTNDYNNINMRVISKRASLGLYTVVDDDFMSGVKSPVAITNSFVSFTVS